MASSMPSSLRRSVRRCWRWSRARLAPRSMSGSSPPTAMATPSWRPPRRCARGRSGRWWRAPCTPRTCRSARGRRRPSPRPRRRTVTPSAVCRSPRPSTPTFGEALHQPLDADAQQWWHSAAEGFMTRRRFRSFDSVYGAGQFTWDGLWTVTAPPTEAHGELVAAWELDPHPVSRWSLPVQAHARVVEIHRPEDWMRAGRRTPGGGPRRGRLMGASGAQPASRRADGVARPAGPARPRARRSAGTSSPTGSSSRLTRRRPPVVGRVPDQRRGSSAISATVTSPCSATGSASAPTGWPTCSGSRSHSPRPTSTPTGRASTPSTRERTSTGAAETIAS